MVSLLTLWRSCWKSQVGGVKEHADMVAKLRRVGKGLGVYQFDKVSVELNHIQFYYCSSSWLTEWRSHMARGGSDETPLHPSQGPNNRKGFTWVWDIRHRLVLDVDANENEKINCFMAQLTWLKFLCCTCLAKNIAKIMQPASILDHILDTFLCATIDHILDHLLMCNNSNRNDVFGLWRRFLIRPCILPIFDILWSATLKLTLLCRNCKRR